MFEGLSVALATPFRDGKVDDEAWTRLIGHLLDGGVQGLVPVGCTGEAAVLDMNEREALVRACVRARRPGTFVLAGTGTNSTRSTCELTKRAEDWGADGALVITPYYNKPTQAGMLRHYEEVARASALPIVLYNVPGRTGVRLEPDTIRRLAEIPRIVAVKEACGSLDQVSEICATSRTTVLSGDDSLTLPMLAVGATGVISVLGNLYPRAVAGMLRAHADGEIQRAAAIHRGLFPMMKALFVETNPGPVKHVLAKLGMMQEELRLPLVPVGATAAGHLDAVQKSVEGFLADHGLA